MCTVNRAEAPPHFRAFTMLLDVNAIAPCCLNNAITAWKTLIHFFFID